MIGQMEQKLTRQPYLKLQMNMLEFCITATVELIQVLEQHIQSEHPEIQ